MKRVLLVAAFLVIGCSTPMKNRLGNAQSPYLRQHADNLVHWQPWDKEALERSRREDKPIFLSVGYSTCHWCHVMEHESFLDAGIAETLNRDFIPIKVDREERPDVDALYVDYLLKTQGSAGWPMTVFLTPDLKPFYAGTYYPPTDLKEMLKRISDLWSKDRPQLLASANEAMGLLSAKPEAGPALHPELLVRAARELAAGYDPEWGGFGGAPKFPRPSQLSLLFRCGDPKLALETLRKMASGGICDPLSGGFHRYSTDREWHIPHFEKMLYDQALIADAYLDGYAVSGEERMRDVALRTLEYAKAHLRDPGGAFYAGEDADSEGAEGTFYTWTTEQLKVVPGAAAFGKPPVLSLPYTADRKRLEPTRRQLEAARDKRPRPSRDDKIITSWNGMMIASLARAGDLPAAVAAAAYLEKEHFRGGQVFRYSRNGTAPVPGFNEDYAEWIHALIQLHQATFQSHYLDLAAQLQELQLKRFWYGGAGGFFESDGSDPSVLVRAKAPSDGPTWTSNGRSALNLVQLAELLDRPDYLERAQKTLAAFADPGESMGMLCAYHAWLGPRERIVVAARDPAPVLALARRGYHPNRLLWLADGKQFPIQERPAVYICHGHTCSLPIVGLPAIQKALRP